MNNFIIDFTNSNESFRQESLHSKLLAKGNSPENINFIRINKTDLEGEISPKIQAFFKKIDEFSRVYIIDHGVPNSPKIRSAHYQELGDLIGKNITNEAVHSPNSRLKISLIPCFSGRGENADIESFAGLFHRYLGQHYHIYSEVLARNELVWIHGEKSTASTLEYAIMTIANEIGISKTEPSKDNILVHQHPGTKISLRWDDQGDEWVLDAYIDKYFSQIHEIVKLLDTFIKKRQVFIKLR